MQSSKIIHFPHRRRLVVCRSCRTIYRLPPPGLCLDCRHWSAEWRTLQRNVAAMQGVWT